MQEIATACGVSHTAVSFVLRGRTEMAISPATRQRIFEQSIAVDYHPQRNSRIDGSKLRVLYLCPDLHTVYADLGLPTNVLAELAEREAETGISFELVAYERPQLMESLYRGVCEGRADAVVLCRVGADVVTKVVRLAPVPVLLLGAMDHPLCDTISIDDVAVGRLAAHHLWENGHRSAAIFQVEMGVGASRVAGFRHFWQKLGGDPEAIRVFTGVFTPESGQRMVREYLNLPKPRPSAIFSISDTIAYGAINELWQHGMAIPDGVSIIGCDDMPYSAWACPPLTSMHHDSAAIANALLHAVRRRCLDGCTDPPVNTLIQPRLLPRKSVASPHAPQLTTRCSHA